MRIADKSYKSDWIRPWDNPKPDDLYNRDDRFFSVLVKGMLAFLTQNISMYGKPIKHFILSSGSSFMYIEINGYKYSATEISGEDTLYMVRPRCVVELGNVTIDSQELSQNAVRGVYERLSDGEIKGFNAEMRRLPIRLDVSLHYVLSTFNEEMVLLQEIIDKMLFQRYFSITYLGQVIDVSITYPDTSTLQLGKVDMSSNEANRHNIDLQVVVETNYPCIDESTESPNSALIRSFDYETKIARTGDIKNVTDTSTHHVD